MLPGAPSTISTLASPAMFCTFQSQYYLAASSTKFPPVAMTAIGFAHDDKPYVAEASTTYIAANAEFKAFDVDTATGWMSKTAGGNGYTTLDSSGTYRSYSGSGTIGLTLLANGGFVKGEWLQMQVLDPVVLAKYNIIFDNKLVELNTLNLLIY
jgi:hypothetical protein